jgi:serine/threonine-protein kinase
MATVYFARQRGAAGFAKAVAIKRMRPDLVHEREFVDLFVDEARLASRVRHANVVNVTDVVASGDELLLVMEYLHGESLSKLMGRLKDSGTPVPPAIAVSIVVGVLHGLHAAHETKDDLGEPLGIVHRDVSPQNVIVGVDGVARVADFGIARAAGQIHATDDGKTRGKARYSAPEQLRGTGVSRRSDLFSAAVLLWEMLVMRPLFEGETQAAIVTAVLTEPISAPGILVPDLPQSLDEVVLRALDRDPKRRYATALEFANALEGALTPARLPIVSEWVHSLAATELAAREAIVRRIQSGADPAPTSTQPRQAAVAVPTELGTEQVVTRPVLPPDVLPPARRRATIPVIALAAAGALVLAAGISFLSRSGAEPAARAPNATAAAQPQSTRSTSELAQPPTAPTPAPPETVVPPPDIEFSATPPSPTINPPRPRSGSPSHGPPVRGRGPTAPPFEKGTTSTAKSKCDPPYDLDSSGRKIFRVDCL